MCTSPVRFHCAYLYLTPSFIFPSLSCSSDCDELSHLKYFLSACIPGGFHSPSIFSYPSTPHIHTHTLLPINSSTFFALVFPSFTLLSYFFVSVPCLMAVVQEPFLSPFILFYPESIIWITIMLLDLTATSLCSK